MARDPQPPDAIEAVLARLRGAGHVAVLVGGCVRNALLGRAVRDYDIATAASQPELLALFPRAVPIGGRYGTVMVPSGSARADVTPFRAGPELLADLALRDFTFNAIAYDGSRGEGRWIDPHGGIADLSIPRVRAVGDPRDRLGEDPLRALRALRFAAELGAQLDPALAACLGEFGEALAALPGERLRGELEALLVARAAGPALARLAASGLGERLAPGVGADAPDLVAQLPPDLLTRLVGWLRGTRPEPILGRLRFPRRLVSEVGRLVRLHPLRLPGETGRGAWARRTLARLGGPGWRVLIAVAEAEARLADSAADVGAAGAARADLLRAEAEGAALGPEGLALSGRDVMAVLAVRPGPIVGRALAHLTEAVLERPELNTPDALAALLRKWGESRNRSKE